MAKIKVIRGIEKGSTRVEAGSVRDREILEAKFGKQIIAHWLKTGVLKLTRKKGGVADGNG